MEYVMFLLLPICAYLNMLGGQSTTLPWPRVTMRMIGIGLVFGLFSWFAGVPSSQLILLTEISIVGQVIWAVFGWGVGFMALDSTITDNRKYNTPIYTANYWVTKFTDYLMKTTQNTVLTIGQIHRWGAIYMTIRGAFHYPFFIALVFMLTPLAAFFGLLCLLQGIIYRKSEHVYIAELWTGALCVGLPMALTLAAYILGA